MKKNYLLNVLILVLLIGTGTGKLLASEYYWIGNTGNWSDLTLWASSSGGAGSAYGVVPTSVDNVHFDANSFTSTGQTMTIDQTIVSCLNMDWTGVANSPTLNFLSSNYVLNISGSLTFVSAMTLTNCGPVNFIATTTGQTVTSAGQSFGNNVTFNGTGGAWTLQDGLSTTTYSDNIILSAGTLNTNNQTVTGGQFISTSGNTRALNMGSSVFNLSWISYPFWQVSAGGMTLNAGTSTINATTTMNGWTPYFIGGGFTYYNLNFTGTNLGTGGGIIDDGGNTFNDVSFADNGAIDGNNTFHNVTFDNNGTIASTNTFNNLTFSPGFTYTLGSGQTQTINGTLSATGNCSSGITIQSSASAATIISQATGSVVLDYVTLTYVTGTGGASFTANDATDGGNNTGWTINVLPPQSLYWIGGSGNWSDGTHWSATSGGSPFNCSPGSGDDVFFDANSFTSAGQTVTLDASTANCKDMTWTGVTNVPTMAGSSSTLNIYGSLTLAAAGTAMNVTFSGPVNFVATTGGQTVTSAGNSFSNNITFNGAGGSWTLQDALSTTSYSNDIILSAGTLNSNNQTVTSGEFVSTSGNTRALNMGSSVFNLSWISYPFWNVSAGGMTLNAGTSTINATTTMNGWTPYFIGGGFTYYNLNFTGTNLGTGGGIIDDGGNTFNDVSFADNGAIDGNNTFHNVTFNNNGTIASTNTFNNLTFSPGFTYTLGSGQTQTINGTFSATGSCTAGIAILSSSTAPTTISIATGTVTLDYVTLTYIAATGGATFIADDATDGGNNTGWTIHSNGAQNLYWVGNTGNWSDGSHWSATSGGSPLGCTPGSADNVFFDANSFTSAGQTVTLDASTANCNNMDWTGVTNVPTLAGSSSTLNIYGSLTLVTSGTGMNVTFSGPVNFVATTAQTITSGGNSFSNNITFNGAGGSWTLQDGLSTTSYSNDIILSAGTLNTNNQTVTSGEFVSTSGSTRTLNMGSSVFNLSWISYPFWNVSAAGMTLNAGTSTINATTTMNGWTPYFVGGGFTYYDLNFTGTNLGTGGGIIDDGGNTFNDVSFADNGGIDGNNTFHNVTFYNNGTIASTNTFNNLTFSPGFTYTITSSTTQTINGLLDISGTGSFPVRIEASSSGTPYIFSKASDTVCADYIRISDNTATGGAVFEAGTNSQDLGGNTGWNFASASTAPSSLNASSNPVCSGGAGTTLTQSGGSLGALAYWQWYSDATYTTKVGGPIFSSNASIAVTPNITTTYYLRAEWASCVPPLPGPGTGVTVTVTACVNTWLGTTNDWNTSTNWTSGIVPACSDNDDSIPATANNPVISSPAFAGNLVINDGVTLTVNAALSVCGNLTGGSRAPAILQGTTALTLTGTALQNISGLISFQNQLALDNTLGAAPQAILLSGAAIDIYNALVLENNNTLNTSQGTLTLKSISVTQAGIIDNFSGSNSGTITGSITAERYYAAPTTTNSYNQHEMGSPVSTPALSQFGASGTSGYVTDADCDGTKLDNSSPYGTVFGYDETHGTACGIQQWKVLTGGNAVNGVGYSIRSGGPGTLSLSGAPNISGNVTVNGTNTGWTNTTLQGYPEQSGWTLASNPYPATLQISTGSLSNNVDAGWDGVGVMVWNTTGGSAGSYQLTTTLAPFQAFMVHKTDAGGSATYTIYATDRATTANTFFKEATASTLNITATNQSSGLTDVTTVGFNQSATSGFDPSFDVHKIAGDLNRHSLYTISNNEWMYQNINQSIEQMPTVPMGFNPGANGTYSLSFDGINSFDATSYITLEDTKLNVFHDVRSGDYIFIADVNDGWNRFVLHFTPPASILTTNATCSEQGMINIIQPGTAVWSYTLADNNNIILSSGTLNVNSSVSASVPVGVYTLTLKDNNGYTVVKTVEVSGAQPVIASFTASANSVNVNQPVTLSSASAGAVLNSWNFGDGTIDNGATVTHAYVSEGVYNVTLNSASASGCNSSVSNTITVTQSITGVTNLNDINRILIWSNENIVNVDFTQLSEVQANIEICNILGQKLSEDKYVTSSVYRKEIPNIEEGYIVVRVKNNDEIITKKLFISNVK